jgi:hypothetical protein
VTRTAVLFPWLRGDPDRDAAARWVMSGWGEHHPDIEVLHSGDDIPATAGWSKGEHLAGLLARTDADAVIVSDVDCWVSPGSVDEALTAVRDGTAMWAIPHASVRRLTQARTATMLASPAEASEMLVHESELAEAPYAGYAGGGVVVLSRQTIEQAPLDPRFVGWGGEDASWAMALETMCGPPWRGLRDLLHLWHAPPPRRSRGLGSDDNTRLYRSYAAANGDATAMQAILSQVRRP